MAKSRPPNVPSDPPSASSPGHLPADLDELARMLAAGEKDPEKILAGKYLLKSRIRRGLGVPFYECDEMATEGIAAFMEAIKRRPKDPALVNGAFLWTVTHHRSIDLLRHHKRRQVVDPSPGTPEPFDDKSCEDLPCDAAARRQEALSLHLHAVDVLRRHGQKLERRVRRALEVMALVAAKAPSAEVAYRHAADMLCDEGVLGDRATRNMRALLDRRPDIRRALALPSRQRRPTTDGSSADE